MIQRRLTEGVSRVAPIRQLKTKVAKLRSSKAKKTRLLNAQLAPDRRHIEIPTENILNNSWIIRLFRSTHCRMAVVLIESALAEFQSFSVSPETGAARSHRA